MRLSARNFEPSVLAMPGTARPVRLAMSGLSYRLEPAEAIRLANQLVDAVEQLNITTPATEETQP